MDAFREGLFQVQGEAAQICCRLIDPGPGDHVLDLCAGLGGKSTHMAARMQDRGLVVALDTMHGRLLRLARSARRLGLSCIRPVAGDAGRPLNRLIRGRFNRVLLDAPCSGLGVLARHPDGKWARDPGDIRRLARLQSRMLDSALTVVGRNGYLLYTTCTISNEENESVVERALREHPGIFLENLKAHVPVWGLDLVDENGFFRTLPHVHGMEGFFGAMFRKVKD
jgi:16S rRNA (cytosine967-C5)-methyltransferase